MARGGKQGAKVSPGSNAQAHRQVEVRSAGQISALKDLYQDMHVECKLFMIVAIALGSPASYCQGKAPGNTWHHAGCCSMETVRFSLHDRGFPFLLIVPHVQERTCPLCIEPLDATEQQFFPCACGWETFSLTNATNLIVRGSLP